MNEIETERSKLKDGAVEEEEEKISQNQIKVFSHSHTVVYFIPLI